MFGLSHTKEIPIKLILPTTVTVEEVTISPSGSSPGSPGDDFLLSCSVTFNDSVLLSDVPSPTFRWSFGPNGNASLPSGVTSMATVLNSGRNILH